MLAVLTGLWICWVATAPRLPPLTLGHEPIIDHAPREFRPLEPTACVADEVREPAGSSIATWSGTAGPADDISVRVTKGAWRIRYFETNTKIRQSGGRPEFIAQIFSEDWVYLCLAVGRNERGTVVVSAGPGTFRVSIMTNFDWAAQVEQDSE